MKALDQPRHSRGVLAERGQAGTGALRNAGIQDRELEQDIVQEVVELMPERPGQLAKQGRAKMVADPRARPRLGCRFDSAVGTEVHERPNTRIAEA